MSNKPVIVALLGGLGLCTPVLAAGAPPTKPSATAKQPDAPHVAARRIAAAQTDPRDAGKSSLTEAQVDEVIKAKLGDVESCWIQAPDDQRKTDANAVLKLEIDDRGEVQTVDLTGALPDDTQRCIALAASGWSFPETDVKIDAQFFEYPLALHAK